MQKLIFIYVIFSYVSATIRRERESVAGLFEIVFSLM